VNSIIKADLYRHDGLRGFRGFLRGWFKPGFRYTYLYRKVTDPATNGVARFFYRFLKRRYRLRYGYEISIEAQIGEGFYLSDHCGPVVIGPIKIGKHCNIAHGVTIGRAYRDGKTYRPTLGDRVWIGTGAVLVGDIKIGSDVLIAPNALVTRSVPNHSLVIGNPARIIPRQNPTKDYINFVLENSK
jgi:serine O-acetyltransferase